MNPMGRPAMNFGCTVEGCNRKHAAKGLCNMHYKRSVVRGQPLDSPPPSAFVHEERIEDCNWMADTGECLTGAAERLDLSRNALENWLRRNDPDCLARLIASEPRDHNRAINGFSVSELTGQRARRERRRERAA